MRASTEFAVALALGSLIVGSPRGVRAQNERVTAATYAHLRTPEKPESVALLLNLLSRYAADVPDKDEGDRRIADALGSTPTSRQTALRLVNNFLSVPLALRQASFGSYADPTRLPYSRVRTTTAKADAIGPRRVGSLLGRSMVTSVRSNPSRAPLTIRFKGLKCFGETSDVREGSSDEVYVVVNAFAGGYASVKVPEGRETLFEGVDAGEVRNEPVVPIITSPPVAIKMYVTLVNQNFSNPTEVKEGIDLVVRAAQSYGDPYVAAAAKIIGAIVSWALPKDRIIGVAEVSYTATEIDSMVSARPDTYEGIVKHFDSWHSDGDASYAVYFDVFRPEAARHLSGSAASIHAAARVPVASDVTPLVARAGHIDLFAVGSDRVARTAWWEPAAGWSPWFPTPNGTSFADPARITAIVPREGHIDLFAVNADGIAHTAWWEAGPGWSQWFPLHPETKFTPGTTITALVPRDGHIDLFAVSADGIARTAWWEGASGWSEWFTLHPETRFGQTATISALVPRDGHIDLFAVDADGIARTAWWESGPGWSQWFPLHPETRFPIKR